MSKKLRELQTRKAGLIKEARALTERASAESRDLSEEETTAFDTLKGRIDAASAAIDREGSRAQPIRATAFSRWVSSCRRSIRPRSPGSRLMSGS